MGSSQCSSPIIEEHHFAFIQSQFVDRYVTVLLALTAKFNPRQVIWENHFDVPISQLSGRNLRRRLHLDFLGGWAFGTYKISTQSNCIYLRNKYIEKKIQWRIDVSWHLIVDLFFEEKHKNSFEYYDKIIFVASWSDTTLREEDQLIETICWFCVLRLSWPLHVRKVRCLITICPVW